MWTDELRHYFAQRGGGPQCRCGELRDHPVHLQPGDTDARQESIDHTHQLAKARREEQVA